MKDDTHVGYIILGAIFLFLILGIFKADDEGYKRGLEEGHEAGYEEGHKVGYEDGYAEAESFFETSYFSESDYSEGQKEAYDDAFDKGYEIGHEDGVSDGYNQALEDYNIED